jgi:hypothetical protein
MIFQSLRVRPFAVATVLLSAAAIADTINMSGFWTTSQGISMRVAHDASKSVGRNLTISVTIDGDDTGRRTVTFEGRASPTKGGATRLYAHAEPFPIVVEGKRCLVTDAAGIGAFGPTFDGTGTMVGEFGGRRIHMEEGCYVGGEIRCGAGAGSGGGKVVGAWGAKCDGVWR